MLINEDDLLNYLKKRSFEIMGRGSYYHDYAHAVNVFDNVRKIIKKEKLIKKSSRIILLTAALFHDIKRNEAEHGLKSSIEAEKILHNIRCFPQKYIKNVKKIIISHDFQQINLDEKILFDADRMDFFNELGMIRSFMMYGYEGLSLKEACFAYDKLLDVFFQSIHLNSSIALSKSKYAKMKNVSRKLLLNYK